MCDDAMKGSDKREEFSIREAAALRTQDEKNHLSATQVMNSR